MAKYVLYESGKTDGFDIQPSMLSFARHTTGAGTGMTTVGDG